MTVTQEPSLNQTVRPSEAALKAVSRDAEFTIPVVFGRARDLLLLGGLLAIVVALGAWLIAHGNDWTSSARVAIWTNVLLWTIASALAIRVSTDPRLDRGSRHAWSGFSAVFAVIAITGSWDSTAVMAPYQSYSTLVVQLTFLAALFFLPSAPKSALDRLTLALDASTVAIGSALVLWYQRYSAPAILLQDVQWSVRVSDVIVIVDAVILLMLSIAWRRTAFRSRAWVTLALAMSVLVMGAAHLGTSYAAAHRVAVPIWFVLCMPVSALLASFAGWLKLGTVSLLAVRTDAHSERAKHTANLIPYIAVIPGFAVVWRVAQELALQPLGALVSGAVILIVLAFVRQMAAGRESVRELSESAARTNEARFQALVQHSSDVITILDVNGSIRYASPSTATIFGHEPAQLIGAHFTDLLHPDDVDTATAFLADLARSSGPRATPAYVTPSLLKREWRIRHANGDWMTVDNVGTNLLREPLVKGLVLNTRDMTEQSMLKLQYMHQAFHDPLTDLANRSLFLYQVGHALARSARHQQPVTVMFLDLDNFKTVNDSLGHGAGDRLLVDAARRLASCVRDSDLISRLGGDEFAVLIEDSESIDDIHDIATRIGAALRKPFHLVGKDVFVSASIGIARTSRGETSDELVRNADVAMYVAKTRGKGTYVLFEPEMHSAAMERLVVEADLRVAIEREEFFLEYQPIVLLTTGEIIGAEALVRWACRERGTVPPGVFIPIAEETGLIVAIGSWVLRRACKMARQWERERGHPMRITVNLSGRQLQEATIVDEVQQALSEAGLEPSHLVLEITESMLMHNTDVSMERLLALKALGVSLAIDDFGTGYSSLSYLQRYPIDILKIDKAFIDDLDKEGEGPVLASAIVALGETLRMNTVAEGIETEAQRGKLLQIGCELGQGYLFAPPLEASEFYRLLLARGARAYLAAPNRRDMSGQAA